jgi:hypothetical protein
MGKIIQFFHPGIEHNVDSGTKWHTGKHKRKFMRTKGSYINESGDLNSGDVHFWGEWEAQSNLLEEYGDSADNKPKFLFEPFYSIENQRDCNTDPFVFGNQFYYCICKQGHYKSMRELESMDIILFGSHKADEFVLDTLFVVNNFNTYGANNHFNLKEQTNETYFDVSIAPIFSKKAIESIELEESKDGCIIPKNKNFDESDGCMYTKTIDVDNYRNYRGVMYSEKDKFNHIYSFVPCSPIGSFARPVIQLNGIINPHQKQGINISDKQDVVTCWNEIVQQIFNQDLFLMVENCLPKKHKL